MGDSILNYDIGFFCDFDGTISENDMIQQIMMHFVPDEAAPIIHKVLSRTLSVQEGVEALFGLIPSSKYPEVVQFAREATRIRPGFESFVEYCSANNWKFAVVSGGFDFFVEPAISAVRDQVDVYCNRIDRAGSRLKVIWDHPCDGLCDGGCGLCKPTVLQRYAKNVRQSVVIGDGVTDLKAAKLADYVFARSGLAKTLQDMRVPFSPFETFYDVLDEVKTGKLEVFQDVHSKHGS